MISVDKYLFMGRLEIQYCYWKCSALGVQYMAVTQKKCVLDKNAHHQGKIGSSGQWIILSFKKEQKRLQWRNI